jgi:hypothetical protein
MTDEISTPAPKLSIGAVRKFFGNSRETGGYPGVTEFKADWDKLTPQDKADLSNGTQDGTLNY